ncbi:MAG: hypothetical protein KGJ12_03815, partial [Gammaproteobacteria bacterium]|nr:hypothetical protein [Gammaproteobacteria bacterium]
MCGGVRYSHQGQDVRLYFPSPAAVLPVRTRSGELTLLPWGRREGEPGALPLGGWARLDSIRAGRWDRWSPTPIKIAVQGFMEKDREGRSHWYDLPQDRWIQGLLARAGEEQRVYVVTVA